jgi:hypothetical protein
MGGGWVGDRHAALDHVAHGRIGCDLPLDLDRLSNDPAT